VVPLLIGKGILSAERICLCPRVSALLVCLEA